MRSVRVELSYKDKNFLLQFLILCLQVSVLIIHWHCFHFVSKFFENALTEFVQTAIIEAIMAGTNSLKRFLEKTPGTEKHNDK